MGIAQSNTNRIELGDNGYVDMGTLGHNVLFHIRRLDKLEANAFYHDAKLRMDLLMKTGIFKRPVGSDSVKITSLGKPESESEYVDRWGRRWQTGVWTLHVPQRARGGLHPADAGWLRGDDAPHAGDGAARHRAGL